MKELTQFDLILARRTRLTNSEIFDLLVHDKEYYRIVITNNFKDNKVKICTNIEEFNKEPLFEYTSDIELLDAIFIQSKFIFENFIAQEYSVRQEDFDVEVEIIEVDEMISKLNNAREKLDYFIEKNRIDELYENGEELYNKDHFLFFELEKVSDDFNEISSDLDNVFIDADILQAIIDQTNYIDNLN